MEHIVLSNGKGMPMLGFGVFQVPPRAQEGGCVKKKLAYYLFLFRHGLHGFHGKGIRKIREIRVIRA